MLARFAILEAKIARNALKKTNNVCFKCVLEFNFVRLVMPNFVQKDKITAL
jgi:hypothetical protein